jgi:hypothetical protein
MGCIAAALWIQKNEKSTTHSRPLELPQIFPKRKNLCRTRGSAVESAHG